MTYDFSLKQSNTGSAEGCGYGLVGKAPATQALGPSLDPQDPIAHICRPRAPMVRWDAANRKVPESLAGQLACHT